MRNPFSIWSRVTQLETEVNQLQSAIATLQADFSALTSAVTAIQATSFTPADVANVTAIDTSVKALTASLTPAPAPAPTPTPAS